MLLAATACASVKNRDGLETLPPPSHESTAWEMRTASGLDALCLVNALAGNPLSLQNLGAEAAYWRDKLDVGAIGALEPFERRVRERREPLNAFLLKPFVAAGAESLDEVIALCGKPDELEAAMKAVQEASGPRNSYYQPEGFKEFEGYL